MAEMINRDAPLSGLSSLMAMKGRQGDTELIHMTKPEIAGLASLGKITINPDTGLPEAFSFKQFLPALAGLAITGATGGLMGPAAAAALQGAFTGSSFVLPALAAGATSAVVNKGDIGAVAFDALLAGAGGALSGATIGADTAVKVGAPNVAATAGQQVTADAAAQTIVKQQAADAVAKEIAQQAAVETTGLTGATTTGALSNVTAAPVTQVAPKPVEVGLGNVLAEKFTGDATKQIGIGSLTTGDVTRAGLGILPTAGLMATGTPTTGGGMLESMKVDTPEIAARKAAESSYGTRAADEVRQPAKADGLTTQEVLSSALGRSDPLTYLSGSNSSNVSAPSSLYGGPTGVVGQPARGAGPVGGYVPAASGGSLQDLYERMGGDIQTFKGLVEGGEIGSDGMSDDIEFDVIDGGEKGPDNALLSKDEYVIDAHTVAALGNGSTDAGADRLDKFVANLRNKAYNKGKQPKQLNGLKELATLMS
jgi:hypothetical protein